MQAEKEKIVQALKGPQFDRERHGSLFDRGSADSYYSRLARPHWYPEGTYKGEAVTNLNQSEIDEYLAGYEWNELHGDKKDWN
jgi:hypothetical protein